MLSSVLDCPKQNFYIRTSACLIYFCESIFLFNLANGSSSDCIIWVDCVHLNHIKPRVGINCIRDDVVTHLFPSHMWKPAGN